MSYCLIWIVIMGLDCMEYWGGIFVDGKIGDGCGLLM